MNVTMHDLRTVYTLEDALDFHEVITVQRVNEHLALNYAKGNK